AANSVHLAMNTGASALDTLTLNNYTGGSGSTTHIGGTIKLAAANSYSGDWAVDGGTLGVQHASALGTGVSAVTINNGGTLQLEGVSISRNAALNDNGTLKGVGTAAFSGTVTAAGSAPNLVLITGSASDALTVNSYAGGSGTTTHVKGSGEVFLA